MKLVEFNRAMSPHVAGETRVLADDVAARLEAEGVIKPNPSDWPEGAKPAEVAAPPAESPAASGKRRRDLLGQTYLTKRQ